VIVFFLLGALNALRPWLELFQRYTLGAPRLRRAPLKVVQYVTRCPRAANTVAAYSAKSSTMRLLFQPP